MKTIFGLFEHYKAAERAISALREHGFTDSQISVLAREPVLRERLNAEKDQKNRVIGAGTIAGTALGSIGGLSIGLLALALPGIGATIGAGVLAAAGWTAAGAAAGAVAGGLYSMLLGWNLSEDEANFYAEGVKRGGVLIAVQPENTRNEAEARRILQEMGVVDMQTRLEEWRRSGWSHFDESTDPGEDYPPISSNRRS